MSPATSNRPVSTIGKRLLAVSLVVVLTCVIISVVLQPKDTSAQEQGTTPTPVLTVQHEDRVSTEKSATTTPTPTPTPGAPLRSSPQTSSAANNNDGSDGIGVVKPRGLFSMTAYFYTDTDFVNLIYTTAYSSPLDFKQSCDSSENPDYAGCKLVEQQPQGTYYSARWSGKILVPEGGNYTFILDRVDDEARLLIDGNEVIQVAWDGTCYNQHGYGSQVITFGRAGVHEIVVEYRQCPNAYAEMQLRWSGPSFSDEVIPILTAPPECDCELRQSSCCEDKPGGPINTRTGNYDYTQQDISISALGKPLQFKRTYNSQRPGDPALGNGWTDNYNLRIRLDPGAVIVRTCQGQEYSFLGDHTSASGVYRGAPGVAGVLTRTGTYGGYTYYLTTANNDRYTFNADGLPTEIRDAQGHLTTLTYAGSQLIRVADATGQRYLNFTYDPQGHLIQISDPLSRAIGYGYDGVGNLSVMTDSLGRPWTYVYTGTLLQEIRNPSGEVVERTEFDDQRRAVRQWNGTQLALEFQYLATTDEWGLPAPVTIITDALGHATVDTYDSRGTLVAQTETAVSTDRIYDYNFHLTEQTDRNGNPTSFIYNAMGRPLVITDALGNDTQLQYDTQNHLIQLTDASGSSSYYTYTGNLLTAQSDALGHTTIYTYNAQNLLMAQQDPQGRVNQYQYDLWGQHTAVTTTEGVMHYGYDRVGRLITTTDTFNRVAVNAYDNADRLSTVTRNYLAGQPQNYQHAYNLIASYGYDLAGRQVAVTDTLGHVTRNVYDGNGQLIETIVNYDPARAQNELNQYNITTQYGYDVAGHQILVTDTLGHASRTDYDAQSRPVTMTTNYQDGVYDPAHPDDDIIRVTQYDPAGNAIAQIDPLGRVTRTWYDEVNRVVSTTSNYDPNRPQNDQGEFNLVTTYGYDATGNRVLITDTLGRVSRNYYDLTGRLISTTANYLPGFEQNHLNQYNLNTFYGYDASGRQVLVTNTLGLANHTAYDPLTGRPLTTTTNYADGVFNPAQPDEDVAQGTEYDVHGNPDIRRDAAGRATRTWYDALNRAISMTTNYLPGQSQNYLGQYNLVTTYGYDEVGNRAWVTDTLGHVTLTQYDALNRAVTMTQNVLAGQPANYLGQYNLLTTYEYDALGRQVATIDPLNRRTHVAFDQVGRTIAQFDPLEQRTTYAYDVLGNRTVITDATNHVTRFEYDTLNRLITTTRTLNSNPIREVTHYDALGNRVVTLDARGQATTYGYDTLGRTIAITDANLHVTTFAYDALGRRTAQTDALQHTTVFTPDRLGRQIAMSDPLGNTTRYGYDVSGNRVVMTDANQIATRNEYDALDRLSAVVENYTGGPQTNDRDVRTTYAYDPLGNRTVMTNARGYTTTTTYDALNRMSGVQDARGKATLTGYDAVGNRTVLTDANNKVTLYAYDSLNRPLAITYTADATAVRYGYDAIGNRTAMTDTLGTTQYIFDDLNRLTSVSDPFAQTVGYAYDAAGNRTNLIYPDGKVVTYTYAAAGLMTGVIDWDERSTTYEYDAANRLVTVTLPNTVQTLYTYDDANRLIHLSHTRLSDDTLLADYEFTVDKVGNRLQVIEAMEYPGDSQAAALPPTLADAIVEAITGHRAPGLSALAMTSTLTLAASPQPAVNATSIQTLPEQPSNVNFKFAAAHVVPATVSDPAAVMPIMPVSAPTRADQSVATVKRLAPLAMPLLAVSNVFSDSFESGNFTAWSAAVTNTGRLSVTSSAARWGTYGMRAVITSTTAMYARDDTPAAESRYRARFYFHTNSITMAVNNAHELFVGRNVTGTNILTVQLSYTGTYRLMAQAVNDSTGISSTAWYPISNTWHFVEIDWMASTSTTAKNGYITLWIDGVQKENKTGIDNDTRRVDEVRLGPLSGIDSGTNGTEYFDAFESRRDTYIGPLALADFTANPISGTAPLTVTITNTAQPTATLTAYLWKFGDGVTSTITNPVHSYLPGYYTVTLTAWNGVYSDTITKTRLITATVKANFSANPVTGTAPLTVTFTNISQPTNGITSYLWKFGDGLTSTITNPVHSYAPGYYTVTLTATSGAWSDTITKTRLITATVKADFSANPMTGTAPLTVTFTNLSQPASGMTSYLWKFGDGLTSTITNPVHSYAAGFYTVTLTASAGSWSDTITKTRFITATIKANFSANPVSGAPPLTVTFTNTSQPASAMTSYLWSFGDGLTSTITNPIHSYALGYYTVTLTAWAGTLKDVITQTNFITAQNQVQANFSANPVTGTAPLTVTFTNSSQPSGAITAYLWKFGDGVTSTITNPVHSYLPGYYTVTLTAWNGVYSNTITKTSLLTATVKADFTTSPVTGTAPLTVTFTNTSQPAGAITSYLWSFGDNVTSTITNPLHTYAPGYYTVTLTGWSGGLKDIITRTRLITATMKADFSGSPTSGRAPLAVTFNNASQPANGISSYLWKFGDGATSTLTNPVRTYASVGVYTVTLTANAVSGMKDSLTRTRYITVTPGLGDPVAVATDPFANEGQPTIAYNPVAAEYLVAWRSWNSQGDIYARRVLSDGTPSGNAIAVIVKSGEQLDPQVAYGAGMYLVVWRDSSDTSVRGQLIQASGALSGTEFVIGSGPSNNDMPAVDFNPVTGEFLAAWANNSGGDHVRVQRITPSGALVGSLIVVSNYNGNYYPAVTNDAAGNYLVAYVCPDSSYFGVCAQRLSGTGALLGAAFSVFDGSQNSSVPAVAYSPQSDEYLIAWRESRASGAQDILLRRISSAGAVLGSAASLQAQTADPYGPAIAYRAGNMSYVVVWPDNRNGNWDVDGTVIDSDGTPLGSMFPIEATSADQLEAAISPQGVNGELLIAYSDNRSGSPDIYSERYDATGANFVAAPRSGIAPLTVIFTDTSTAPQPVTSWLWNFGDGVTSTQQFPTHSYNMIGYFTVTLDTWAGALHNTIVKPQYVATTPRADFTIDPTQGETPLAVTFNNTSQPLAGITGYEWNFGDGFTTTAASPVHTYTAYSPYTVTLTAFSNGGANTLVRPAAVNVWPGRGERVPIATQWWTTEERSTIAYNADAQEYLAVWDEWYTDYDIDARRVLSTGLPTGEAFAIFTGSGDQQFARAAYGAGVYLVVWQDDNTNTVRGQVVQASGVLSGTDFPIGNVGPDNNSPAVDFNPVTQEFLVTWVYDDYGNNDLWAQRLTASGQLIGSTIFVSLGGGQELQPAVAHDAAGHYLIAFMCDEYPDQFAICVQPMLGNGSLTGSASKVFGAPSNSVSPDLAYDPERNEYLVVWLEGAGGATDEVYAQRLRDDGAVLGSAIPLQAYSGSPYRPAVAYHSAAQAYVVVWNQVSGGQWDIQSRTLQADGSGLNNPVSVVAASGDQVNPALSKHGPGFDLYVLYTDPATGFWDLYGQRYVPLMAYLTATPNSGYAPLSVQFHDRSTAAPIDTRQWDFGDGTGSNLPDPVHGYAQPGDYTTVLTITASGQTYHTAQTIHVADPLNVQFTATPVTGMAPLAVTFTDQSTVLDGVIRSWTWNFGDGYTSTLQNPIHQYSRGSTYDVQLTVHTDTYTKTVTKPASIQVGAPHRTVINYTYDGLYRLTDANYSTGQHFQYAYDAVGNRTTQTATITSTQVTNYVYDAANRLTNRTESTGQAYTYAWSDRGQMLAEYYQSNPIRTFTYNAAGQLSEATVLTLTTRFRYNGDGQRLSLEVVGGNTTTYTLDYLKSNRILMETTAQTTTLYLYGHSCLGEWNATEGWKYYLQSTLGQVRQAVDAAGNVIYSWAYNPDGTVLQGVQGPITHLECDAVYDWSTGLIYRLGRYFDPTTGVWLMGTGMVLAQAGAKDKRRSKRRLLLLLLLLLCVGSVLAACNQPPPPCTNTTPFGQPLGENAVFVDPPVPGYADAVAWNSSDMPVVETALTSAIGNYGGSSGFGSLGNAFTEFGVSTDTPIQVVRRSVDSEPNTRARGGKPYISVFDEFFEPGNVAAYQEWEMTHEMAHYWDQAQGGTLNTTMQSWVNWGQTATDYGTKSPVEDLAEAVRVYFYWQYDEKREWTDDKGAGYDKAVSYGATGPDQLKLDATTMMPSAIGTEEVNDRYDFVQWKLTGKWK
jgi:YD repeat-containing protein